MTPGPLVTVLSQAQTVRNRHVLHAEQITEQLTDLYSQLAFHKGSELRLYHETLVNLMATQGINITTAREQAAFASHTHKFEVIKLQGEIDGLLLALQHCDRALTYWTQIEGSS